MNSPVVRRRIRRTAGLLGLPAVGLVIAQIVLAAPPSADFSISDTTLQVGQTVTFDASASSDPDADIALYEWDFDYDGTTFSADASGATPSISHAYLSGGPRNVALRVSDTDAADGTFDVAGPVVRSLTVAAPPNQPPVAQIACDPALVNVGVSVSCSASGSSDPDGSISEYEWSVDGGSFTDGDAGFSTSFGSAGAHTIRLRVRDNNGTPSAIVSDSVSVNASPNAAVTAAADPPTVPPDVTVDPAINQGVPTPLVGQTVQFDSAVSSDPGGAIASRSWDVDGNGFNDGTGVTLAHAFTTAGTKTVRVQVVDDNGATDIASVSFRVNRLPTVGFITDDQTPVTGQTLTFSSTSSDPDSDISSHAWDFDNDGQFGEAAQSAGITCVDPQSQIASCEFANAGTYPVRLRVTDTGGISRVATRQIVVTSPSQPPTAVIACTPELVNPGATVTCTSAGSSDPDGPLSEYEWSVDNGPFIDGNATFSTSFTSPGPHSIRLRVRDGGGTASSPVSDSVTVNAPPVANIQRGAAAPQNLPADTTVDASINQNVPLVGQLVQLNSSGSSDPGGSVAARAWDIDGDGFNNGSGVTLEHAFTTPGQKTVRLQVTDNNGAASVASVSFRVNSLPTAGFITDNLSPVIDQSIAFSSSSTDPDNDIAAFAWDFDDDGVFGESAQSSGITCQSSQSPHASCQFANAGSYRISLRVTDTGGVSHIARRQVLIQSTVPKAGFSFSPDAPLPGQAVTLSSTSTPSAGKELTGYEWDLNYDGISFSPDAAGHTVTHHFPSPGTKTVALKVSERVPGGGPATGGFAIVARTITVNAAPTAALRTSAQSPFVGEAVTVSSTAADPDGPIESQNWDLDGDGQFDDAAGPVVSTTYPTPGQRRIGLRVTDSKGAVATASGVIDVRARPLAMLSGVVVGIKGRVTGRFTRLTRLSVKAPLGTAIKVTCRAKGCPKQAVKRGTGRTIRLKALERRLPAGTKVVISVTKTGFIGRQTTYTMRRGRGPKRVDLCLMPGAKRATSCPA